MHKNYLIKKWLDNDLNPDEQKAFEALEDHSFFDEIIQEGKRFKGQNTSKVTSFENLEEKLVLKPKKTPQHTKIFLRVAAVLVIGFGLYGLLNTNQENTFNTQLGQSEQITLPDSSSVRLNGLSQLTFSTDWSNERSVALEGEAFFKVAKGKRFDVKTDFGKVSVLGTQFNVKARDSFFSVTCYEGMVQVAHNNTIVKLPAGRAYRFANNKLENFDVIVTQPEWLQNLKVFDNVAIEDVFKSIEQHYEIDIDIHEVDESILFTGAFELDNLRNALDGTTKSLNLTYEINEENMVIVRNAKE